MCDCCLQLEGLLNARTRLLVLSRGTARSIGGLHRRRLDLGPLEHPLEQLEHSDNISLPEPAHNNPSRLPVPPFRAYDFRERLHTVSNLPLSFLFLGISLVFLHISVFDSPRQQGFQRRKLERIWSLRRCRSLGVCLHSPPTRLNR